MKVTSWNIDIDQWLNPYIPRNQLSKLPRPVSRFLGYRDEPHHEIGNIIVAWWACFGAFTGVVIIEAVLMIPAIHDLGVPVVIASFVGFPVRGSIAKLIPNRARLPSLSTTSLHRPWPNLGIVFLDTYFLLLSAYVLRNFSCLARTSRSLDGWPAHYLVGWLPR